MADQNITALPVATAPASSDQLLLVGATEEKLIDYDKLADAILQKLTSKQYTLDQGTKTLPAALNELNSNSFSTYETDNTSQVILPVKSGGATVIIAYTLGGSGHDGANAIMTLFRYSYDGTKCSINYIYNYGNTIIESSISNNKNTIIFKNGDMMPITYLRVKTFDIL